MRAKRKDVNQSSIEKSLKQLGFSVADTSALGNGFPDMVVGYAGTMNYLFEVKDPNKPPSKRKLTPDEQTFKEKWRGQYAVIETVDDALRIINLV